MAKNAIDTHGKTPDELKESLLDLKKQQFNLRFQRSQGGLANTAQLRHVRRDIARVQTAQGAALNPATPAKAPKAKKVKAEGAEAAPAKKKPAAKKAAKKSAE